MRFPLSVLFLSLTWLHAARAQPALPAEVRGYYEAVNFAAAFSTPAERTRIAGLPSPEAVRERTGSQRLAAVYRHLAAARDRLLPVDTEMIRPRPDAFGLPSVPSRLVIIDGMRREGDVLYVRLVGHDLRRGANLRLVARYEGAAAPAPLPEKHPGPTFPELHRWVHVDGSWYTTRAYLQYLDAR